MRDAPDKRALSAAADVVEPCDLECDLLEGHRAALAGRRLGQEAKCGLRARAEREMADELPEAPVGRCVEGERRRAIRSQTWSAATAKELQSSETSRVTTETTIGVPSGARSKQSFAQQRSSTWSASTPAS